MVRRRSVSNDILKTELALAGQATSTHAFPVLTLFLSGAPAEYTSSFFSSFIPSSFFVPLQPGTVVKLFPILPILPIPIPMPIDLLHLRDFLSSSSMSDPSSSSIADSSYSTTAGSRLASSPGRSASSPSSSVAHPPSPVDNDLGRRGSGSGANRIRGCGDAALLIFMFGIGSIGETGNSGESGSILKTGEETLSDMGPKAGEGGHETSDSRRALRRMPPLGVLPMDENDGLGGIRREGKVGETPSEVMCCDAESGGGLQSCAMRDMRSCDRALSLYHAAWLIRVGEVVDLIVRLNVCADPQTCDGGD